VVHPGVATIKYISDVLSNGDNHSMARYGTTMRCSDDLPKTPVNARGVRHGNPDVLASSNFSLAEYEKTRLIEKSECMEHQRNDRVAHSSGHRDECEVYHLEFDVGVNESEDEDTRLLPDD
jgi:hypothetical protein